uniref:Carboxymethylenebutenolidase homolog n=1 Tax=Podarcis muralis TaxID=64176 RepID=A0A670IWY7_PODMU|nr:carboxymethylenebutenolidase homolog [Podarcis muralis]XP_028591666.1 carboxymethylenebutenolidase homolog [Podarcis muralis]XP_028591668.1 carboxymethylenebutenolidase homolog [Podarcis muralis]
MTSQDLPFQYDVGRRSTYTGRGQDVQVDNIKAYVCQPPSNTDKAVIVIHDIYGWQFPDTRYIADMVAAKGYITICPDFFLGKEPWKTTDRWQNFADWLKHRDPTKVDKTAAIFMKYLKEQYNAMKIGVIGFSWGGMAVHHLMLTNPDFQAGVSLYGIIRDSESRYNLLNPTFFMFGGKDHTISSDQVTLLEGKLAEYCRVPFKVKVYPGQEHGFAQLKPDDMKPENQPYIEEARMDMIDWLNRYIMF